MKDNFVSLFKLQLKNVFWDYSQDCDYEGVVHDILRSKISQNTEVTVVGFVMPLLYTVTFYKEGTEVYSFSIWIFSKLYREISALIKRKKLEKVRKKQEEFFKEFLEG